MVKKERIGNWRNLPVWPVNSLFPELFLDSLRIRQRHTYKTELQKIKLKKIEGNREVEFNKELEKIQSQLELILTGLLPCEES